MHQSPVPGSLRVSDTAASPPVVKTGAVFSSIAFRYRGKEHLDFGAPRTGSKRSERALPVRRQGRRGRGDGQAEPWHALAPSMRCAGARAGSSVIYLRPKAQTPKVGLQGILEIYSLVLRK